MALRMVVIVVVAVREKLQHSSFIRQFSQPDWFSRHIAYGSMYKLFLCDPISSASSEVEEKCKEPDRYDCDRDSYPDANLRAA
jgi:hypothetical protein